MNLDQVMGIVRMMIPGIAAAVSHWGVGTDAQNTAIITAIVTAVIAAWDAYTNSQTAMIQSVNEATNGVKVVASTSTAPQVDAPITPGVSK